MPPLLPENLVFLLLQDAETQLQDSVQEIGLLLTVDMELFIFWGENSYRNSILIKNFLYIVCFIQEVTITWRRLWSSISIYDIFTI